MATKEDVNKLSIELHNKHKGKICVTSKVPLKTKFDLTELPSLAGRFLRIKKRFTITLQKPI